MSLVEGIAVTLVTMEHAGSLAANAPEVPKAGDGLDELDGQLCRDCVSGNGDACRQLFKRHEPRIAHQMWRFSRDRGTHAELVQEVFVQAYLSLHRYRPTGVPLEHWLVRIATRVGYRFWKQQSRVRKTEPLGLDLVAPSNGADDAAEAARTLHNLLALLPAADRLVLTFMYFDECGISEIANRTGWNQAMVKMRLYRARNRLRKIIERKNLKEILGVDYGRA